MILPWLKICGPTAHLSNRGGSRGPPQLCLDQNEARRAKNSLFGDRAFLYLWVWMTRAPFALLKHPESSSL